MIRAEVGLGEQAVEEGADESGVFTRGQLGHHAAEEGVDIRLAGDDGGAHAAVIDKGEGGLVAGAFYSQNQHKQPFGHGALYRRRPRTSSCPCAV